MRNNLIISAVLLLLLCACAPQPPSGQAPSTTQPTQNKNLKDGGTLNLCALRPDTFNPLFTAYAENREVLCLVYEPLVRLGGDFKPNPCLAQSWSISDMGKRLYLELRQDAKWHNGGDFTADDVVYTFGELQNSTKQSIYRDRLKNVSSVKKSGSYGVEITLNNPQAGFVNLLDFPIIKRGTASEDGGMTNGTGKYKMTDYVQMKRITLSANPSWWGAEKPHIPTVNVSIVPDYDAVLYSYNSRVIDAAAATVGEMSKYSLREGTAYAAVPSNDYYFMGLNMASLLFSDAGVRKALSAAIDTEKMVKDVMIDFAAAATRPMHPSAWFCTPSRNKKTMQDAKTQLEISGWQLSNQIGMYEKRVDKRTVRLSFELLVNEENPQKCSLADYIANQLTLGGIKVTVKKVNFEEFTGLLASGSFDAFLGSSRLMGDYDLTTLLGTGGSLNFGHYTNADMDAAIAAVNSAETQDQYAAALEQLQILFNDQQPHIPLAFENRRLVYDSAKLGGDFSCGFSGQYANVNKWYAN